jgi:hypothetical protein
MPGVHSCQNLRSRDYLTNALSFHSAAVWHPVKRRVLIGSREVCLDEAVAWEDLAGHHDPCRHRNVEYHVPPFGVINLGGVLPPLPGDVQ